MRSILYRGRLCEIYEILSLIGFEEGKIYQTVFVDGRLRRTLSFMMIGTLRYLAVEGIIILS
jgi:hypothetical protein